MRRPVDAAPTPAGRRWSLALRITVLALVPTLLVTALGGWWLRRQVHESLYASFEQTLADKAQRIAARLRVLPDATVRESAGSGDEFSAIFSGWYWRIEGAGVQARSRSLWDQPDLATQALPMPGATRLRAATGPQDEALLMVQAPVMLSGWAQPLQLQVFGPSAPLQASMARIDRILWLTGGALLLLLCALTWLQVRVGLAPLTRLVSAIASLRQPQGAGTVPPARLRHIPLGPDLAPLREELAAVLAHNAQVVGRARAHAADLNHALKKPLTLLAAAASDRPQVPGAEVLAQTRAMASLIDRYQARTHSDAVHSDLVPGGRFVDVPGCAARMLAMMRRLHAAQNLDWQLIGPDAALSWRGERTDLEELLGNLLDNAGKWAASRVRLTLRREEVERLRIDIEDDGPGMTDPQLQAAGARGLRFDESVEGTGLGLAIARQIAHSYRGAMALSTGDSLGGLRATVWLTGLTANRC
jgi:signal transduction histidine kinase